MPEFLIVLLVLCAALLACNGTWDAFFREDSDRKIANWGMIKFILAIITLAWAFVVYVPPGQGG